MKMIIREYKNDYIWNKTNNDQNEENGKKELNCTKLNHKR